MKTLVLGLGNPILSDDGVGVKVAAAVQAALPPGAPVEVDEACVGGLSLMERMVGYDRVILIDALCHGDTPPGALHRLTLDELAKMSPTQHSASAHDTNLVTALATGRRMALPLPDTVCIVGVTVVNVSDFDDALTPAVDAAVPAAVRLVLAELGYGEDGPPIQSRRREGETNG